MLTGVGEAGPEGGQGGAVGGEDVAGAAGVGVEGQVGRLEDARAVCQPVLA